MIDERSMTYLWAAWMWGGWSAALVTAAMLIPQPGLVLALNLPKDKR